MSDREITRTRKDSDHDITALCDPGASWSPRSKSDAISDIEYSTHTYFVRLPGTGRVDIHVAHGPNGKYLRTDPDKTTTNNLDSLPDC